MVKTDYLGIHDGYYAARKCAWSSEAEVSGLLLYIQNAFRNFRIPASAKVLELGCGTGELALELAKNAYDTYGIDISPAAIRLAQEINNHEKLSFTVGNILNLPYADFYFDGVIDSFCFHCIIGDDRQTFLRETCRVLKKGGIFLGCTMYGEPPLAEMPFYNHTTRTLIKNGIHGRYFGKKEDILSEIGQYFAILESSECYAKDDCNATLLFVGQKR